MNEDLCIGIITVLLGALMGSPFMLYMVKRRESDVRRRRRRKRKPE